MNTSIMSTGGPNTKSGGNGGTNNINMFYEAAFGIK